MFLPPDGVAYADLAPAQTYIGTSSKPICIKLALRMPEQSLEVAPPPSKLSGWKAEDSSAPPKVREALLCAIDDGPQAVALFDPTDLLAYGNKAFREAWGVEEEAFPSFASIIRSGHSGGKGALIETDDIEFWIDNAHRRRRQGPSFRAFEVDFSDGRWFWLTERRLVERWILLIGQDITALKHNEQTLRAARDEAVQASLTDPLTHLANRRHAMDQLSRLFESRCRFPLALIDIDHFKQINDSFGHAVGDEILKRVARELERLRDDGCIGARLAGDEFAVAGPPDCSRDRFERLLDGIAKNLASPVNIIGNVIRLELSIGVAMSFQDGADAGSLLASADAAMYEAKRSGRSTLRFFESWMGQTRLAQAELNRDLPLAIANNEIVPFYQPIADLRTGLVLGLEALVRWRHPTRGPLTPSAFAAVFDDPKLAVMVDDFMLEAALSEMKGWLDQGLPVSVVNVNASDAQLHRPDLASQVEKLLLRIGLSPDRLNIEVVETASVGRDPEHVAATIKALAELGVVCALDDFGTGYASLSHLRQFRVGGIKIDRSFVANICADPFDRCLVKGLIEFGRSVGMRITAEGVETPEQFKLLRELGCEYGQGYWIGRPVAADGVADVITRWYAKFASLDAGSSTLHGFEYVS